MTTNTQQEIERIEGELRALRARLEAEEQAKLADHHLPGFKQGKERGAWHLESKNFHLRPKQMHNIAPLNNSADGPVIFANEADARAFGEAMAVLIELRRQPGVQPANDQESQHVLVLTAGIEIQSDYWTSSSRKSTLSPAYATPTHAMNALRNVGSSRVLAAFRYFMGMTA